MRAEKIEQGVSTCFKAYRLVLRRIALFFCPNFSARLPQARSTGEKMRAEKIEQGVSPYFSAPIFLPAFLTDDRNSSNRNSLRAASIFALMIDLFRLLVQAARHIILSRLK